MASATLSPANELDPVTMMPPNSTATGMFNMTYNASANDITYSLTYSGLTSASTMGHIHYGPPGETGAPLVSLFDFGMPPSQNMTSDTMSGTLTIADFMPDSVDGISTWADAIAAIQSGNTYVNIHSMDYPAGEIRGQLIPSSNGTGGDGPGMSSMPEPRSLALLAIGGLLFVALGKLRGRRA